MRAVRARRMFDGRRLVDDPIVFLDGKTIAGVGGAAPEDVPVEDLGDVTLLPGLIDCHQHLCFNCVGTLEEQVSGIDDDDLLVRASDNARQALRAGVTTVRDLGDRRYVTLPLREDPMLPTILSSGPPITPVQGHCWYLGGECDGGDSLARVVNERAERGCDVIKVMVSGGALTPTFPVWESQFSLHELRSIVDAAHRLGLPVAAHCHAVGAIEAALDAGADSIEHCTFMTAGARSVPSEPLMARIAAAGVTVSTTIGVLPDAVLPPIVQQNLDNLLYIRRRFHELGATLVAGTDAGISAAKPHDVLPHAFREFLNAGMSPDDAMRALTSTPARALGLGARKGHIAAGFDADLLAVHGDPWRDATAMFDVAGVWRAGESVTIPA